MKVVNINLPGIKDEVLISLFFPFGYLNENNSSFGLTHVTEHYLASVLEKKYKPIYIDATIDNVETAIHFSFKKGNDIDPQKIISDINNLTSEIDLCIIDNEKKRVEIEIEEKYSDILNEITHSIESKVINTPDRLKKCRLKQIRNVRSFKEKDIVNSIKNLLGLNVVVFVGFYDNKDDNLNLDISQTFDISLVESKQFKIKSKNKILKKLYNSAVVFPIPEVMNDLMKYYSFEFISEYFNTKLSEEIFDLGVYKTEYDYQINKKGGYIWYFFNGYKKIGNSLIDIMEKVLLNIKNYDELDRNISAFKDKTIRELEFNWNDFYGRFDWIIGDYISKGYVDDLDIRSRAIKDITKTDILNLLSEVFLLNNIKIGK